MSFQSRRIFGPCVLTQWVEFEEAGETLDDLQNYLDGIYGHRVEIFEEGFRDRPFDPPNMWGIAEREGFQFRMSPTTKLEAFMKTLSPNEKRFAIMLEDYSGRIGSWSDIEIADLGSLAGGI